MPVNMLCIRHFFLYYPVRLLYNFFACCDMLKFVSNGMITVS